ncbi:hypothetical protein CLAFUW4_04864 [Fulvia fulva]|uniref:Rhodopsin domain-containing protein n=1 Tax=Passalora fulva TaxID=5499 RepID=A0A9Q8PIE9_PASFU|nr:uncharacterized protein CLAFUR5_12041 [Fulvia fulva]KAK4626284.1 hypothetical protein CLAFUR4_04850 [Fulvia fulva]KAK4628402.1 hypothetical protein CLAFUR0_04854 [Fulvia fulva]UJO23070.1 hypothetical protein CLAFUR5_12041 [Fulvia fulva]WPV14043.1 hypothetical protein CLAFUW4_04864 [Fulvia fulva]WPV28653.1 hypothetical protein CLAFUW7_04858 [Fulvia fulva]
MLHFPRQEMLPSPSPDSAYCQETNRHEILGTTGAMMTVAIIIAGLRITVRTLMIKADPSTKCFSNNTFTAIGLYNSSVNCITDFMFAIISIPIIVKLRVNNRTKVSLACVLSWGYIACAAGIQHSFLDEVDALWHNDFNVWNMIELCVGIVAASLPALRPFFASLLDRTRTYLSSGSTGSHNRTNPEPPDGSRPSDVKLNDWQGDSKANRANMDFSSTTKIVGDPDVYSERVGSARNHRYTVGVTAGRDPGDDGSWEDIGPASNRSLSEETLGRPAIYKTTEITTWSNPKAAYLI